MVIILIHYRTLKRKATISGGLLESPLPQVLAMVDHGIGAPEAYKQSLPEKSP